MSEVRMTGAFDHKDVGRVMIGGATVGTYRISFVNRVGQICTIYRSRLWVRRALKVGDLVPITVEESSDAVHRDHPGAG